MANNVQGVQPLLNHKNIWTRSKKINILQMFHAVIHRTNVDYAALLWLDFMNNVKQKKETIQYEEEGGEMGSLETRTEEMQAPIPTPPRSPRTILSLDKNITQELTYTSSTSNTSCKDDDIHSHHDDHQKDDAPPEEEKRVKRHKASKSLKSARGSSSKHSVKGFITYVSTQQQQQEWDAWVEDTVIDEDEVIPEDETPELIIDFQDKSCDLGESFDFHLGIESYQIKVNLTAPTLTFLGIEAHEPYSKVDKPSTGYESYHVVPPPPTISLSPSKLDLSNSGLEEFKQPEFESYGPKTSKSVSEDISTEVKESFDVLLVKKLMSDDKLEKKIVVPTNAKIEFVRAKQ
nr:hypothetical protein [Tanacetum cinerariifolium]